MKYTCLIVIFLLWGLVIGCASTSSQSNSEQVSHENVTSTTSPPATSVDVPATTPTAIATATPVPATTTSTATETPAAISTEEASTTANTPLPQPSVTPLPVDTPTLQPTTAPATEAAPAVSEADVNTEDQAKRGLEVYKQLYCGLCHQLDLAGTAGTFGPSHNHLGTEAEQWVLDPRYTGKATTAAEYIHESIVEPKAFLVPNYEQTPHQMPIYNYLSEADVAALVQLLLQQK